jgi:tRNA-splicing ligase RtcB (3'-phosphate/5'-hydroxy nucleic acid ligase)
MLKKITDFKYEIEKHGDMKVPGMIYTGESGLKDIGEEAITQVENVACLPGIRKYSIAMPDIHWGYGFPIGGVAAFDADEGVISPGGVGYDINCGVRMLRTNLDYEEIKDRLDGLADKLFNFVPSGVGSSGDIDLKKKELDKALVKGAAWAVERGYGSREDLERVEDSGRMEFNPDAGDIFERAYERGRDQLGTLGAGNHFLEVQRVDKIYLPEEADKLKLFKGQVVVMFHTGSRGFGYQVCDDYLRLFHGVSAK